jgi:plastocyanin
MGKQTFNRIKKTAAILLAIFFIATLTAASATYATPSGTSQSSGGGGKTVDVSIQGFAFNPASVQISTGDTVRWTNMDSADHTVTGSAFKSGIIPKGQNFEFQFTKPGVYNYVCSIHPSMRGTVTVV